jgi:cytoskeletal protein CcmA (bactofilin family)
VHVQDRVVIHGTGRLLAEVFAATLVVDEGGVLEGPVHMTQENNAPTTAT